MKRSQKRHVARRRLIAAQRYAHWPRERLFTAFVGLLKREGWTVDQIDAASDETAPDREKLRERFAWFMAESRKKGLI